MWTWWFLGDNKHVSLGSCWRLVSCFIESSYQEWKRPGSRTCRTRGWARGRPGRARWRAQAKGSSCPSSRPPSCPSSHSSAGRGPPGGSTRALVAVLGGPFMEGAGRLRMLLWQRWSRWGRRLSDRFVTEAWGQLSALRRAVEPQDTATRRRLTGWGLSRSSSQTPPST